MRRQPSAKTARVKVIGATVSQIEEDVILRAFRKARYAVKGTAAREVLIAWARGELVPREGPVPKEVDDGR
jgi:hypothetical protein